MLTRVLKIATSRRVVRRQSATISLKRIAFARTAFSISFWAIFACIWCCACEKPTTQIEIVSFEQERLEAEQFVESFPDGRFARDAYQNVNITFEIPPTLVTIERPATAAEIAARAPADSHDGGPLTDGNGENDDVVIRANSVPGESATSDITPNTDDSSDENPAEEEAIPMVTEQVYIGQILHIEMLWQPRPGKTYAERTQTDAGITYCLQCGAERARYEGAGFVYFSMEDDGNTIVGEIESATLYPAGATDDTVAVLGSCRIRGPFVASRSLTDVMGIKRRIRSEFEGLERNR